MIEYQPWVTFEDQLTIEFCGIYMFDIPIAWNRENFYDQLGHPDTRRYITFYGFLEEWYGFKK